MDRTTLGRNILPLERDGLIRIEPSASDRRGKELHLTKAGEKRLQAALKRWSQAQTRFETVFGAKRAADLRALLRAAVRANSRPRNNSPTGKVIYHTTEDTSGCVIKQHRGAHMRLSTPPRKIATPVGLPT